MKKQSSKQYTKVVASIVKNIDFLHRMKEFPHIQVYNRKGERLCDTQDTPDMNPGDIFKKEFERPLSQAEREAIVKGYEAYVPKEKILTLLDEC